MNSQTRGYWIGALAAPLPFVLLTIVALTLTIGLSETLAVFVAVIYALVLIPLAIAYGLLRWLGWQSLLAHATTMFLITFLTVALSWHFSVSEDSNLTVELDDGVDRPLPLPVAGAILALLVGLIETLCMTVFWLIAIRGRSAFATQQGDQLSAETGHESQTNDE